jgi:signal transduction histidine kinase/CheY-like chemotaxis protein
MQDCNECIGDLSAQSDVSHASAWSAFQSNWDFFTNFGHYIPRVHFLQNEAGQPDWPWIIALLLLTGSIVVGYLKIFVFWRKSYLEVAPQDRNGKLMDLAYLFLWCATCGYALSMVMFFWPAYRLLAIALLVLNIFTWRFASSLNDFKVSFSARQLQRRLDEALQQRTLELEKQVAERTEALIEARAAAEAASVAKSNFLANMSHEIRTPMTAILGFSELLSDPSLDETDRSAHVRTIQDNGTHLLSVINDILDFSKIEAGKLKVEIIECDPMQLISGVRNLLEDRARNKGLHLRLHTRGHLPERIHTDPTRLRQVLTNLVGNAIKFTESGSVCIEAAFHATSNDFGTLHLHVSDTGIGMTDEQVGRLFTAFNQADTSTTRRFGGTGLGLSISKRLVELLGGTISVDTLANAGSTFSVILENVRFTSHRESMPPPVQPPEPSTKLNARVLVAEDGADNQRLFAHHLRGAGVNLTIVDNGQAAVDAALQPGANFDLILMDMQMPILDGYAAVTQLRIAGITVPILAVTAHTMTGDREKCIAAGCSGFLSKPFTRSELLESCRRALLARSASINA